MVNLYYVFDESNIYTVSEERALKRIEILKGSLTMTFNQYVGEKGAKV